MCLTYRQKVNEFVKKISLLGIILFELKYEFEKHKNPIKR